MIIQIDFNSDEAIYVQLQNQIIMGIATDMLREGDMLPSVRQMAETVGINMHTVNKAYTVLKLEGFVKVDRRRGAVIAIDLDKIKAIVKYVEEHYSEPISVGDAAAISGYSESHFMKFFKENMGTSFIAWLDAYRLSMAARMLILTDNSILQVSTEAGFSNLSYFNRSFKARYGMTPRQYRKQGK